MTRQTKQSTYAKISRLRRMERKGGSTRVLHTVERQLRRASEPKKVVDK